MQKAEGQRQRALRAVAVRLGTKQGEGRSVADGLHGPTATFLLGPTHYLPPSTYRLPGLNGNATAIRMHPKSRTAAAYPALQVRRTHHSSGQHSDVTHVDASA